MTILTTRPGLMISTKIHVVEVRKCALAPYTKAQRRVTGLLMCLAVDVAVLAALYVACRLIWGRA